MTQIKQNTNDEKLPGLIAMFNKKIFYLTLGGFFILFFCIKVLYYTSHENCLFKQSMVLTAEDIVHHMDLLGYIIGAIGIYIAGYIARKVEENNKLKNRELEEKITKLNSIEDQISKSVNELRSTTTNIESTNKEIINTTKNLEQKTEALKEQTERSIDASRRIIEDIPEIFENIENILKLASNAEKFYYMNEPVSFGRIHSFNRRILSYFKEPNGKGTENYEINLCNNHVVNIAELITDASKNVKDFRMIVRNPNSVSKFAEDYLISENKNHQNNEGVIYYEIESRNLREPDGLYIQNDFSQITIKNKSLPDEDKREIEVLIKNKFLEFNNYVLERCKSNLIVRGKEDFLQFNDEECLYQLYLTKNGVKRSSLLIFFHEDEATKSRKLVGFSSDNPHIYKGLEDIYLEKFNKLKKTKQ